ncbi:hypothetical protein CRUP_029835 [Coryphaenoides rupestris]|nr:hypothetical protein CRUP_029835 [Coryphaenoides rupestris]
MHAVHSTSSSAVERPHNLPCNVSQGNVPGVESASLAMDTEEGVEVVWNEVLFPDKKVFKSQEDKIKEMFENLMQVEHPNIVKFHKYWLDMRESQARVIFITEYMSSGSLKQFLKKTKKNQQDHGTSVFPDAQGKGRPHRDEQRNLHFFPPEYGTSEDDYAIDIFSFGICALEMAVLEIQANGDAVVSKEAISSAGHSLEDPLMKEFTQSCVRQEAKLRPTAHDLLFHRVLFEVHSLKLLAAHCLISNQCESRRAQDLTPSRGYSHVSPLELDKFLEDVKNGIYPLMNFASSRPHPVPRALSLSQEQVEAVKTPTPEPQETETRKVGVGGMVCRTGGMVVEMARDGGGGVAGECGGGDGGGGGGGGGGGDDGSVSQGNVPGVESASLAMDTEEGVEVVWNEVLFPDKKVFKSQEDKIKEMFENLMQVEHPNIVKFHKYWLDMRESQARVIFITEYMSSGSLKQFLKKTKKNHKTMNVKAWKRWCTQILSALSYLHSCDPPIIHGNLTCDTIFIQHNGLIKIGSVFPDAQGKGRPHRDEQRNLHFFPPEYGTSEDDYAIDIFSFGICALEMAVLEIQANGDAVVSKEAISSAGHSLEDPLMKEFTQSCVRQEAKMRPTAHDLLFHRVLFEVHSLKLLAAHCLISNQCESRRAQDLTPSRGYSHVSPLELDKFLEDVKNGIYPLMNFASSRPHPVPRALSLSQEQVEAVKTPTPEPQETETRKVGVGGMVCRLVAESSKDLANELVHYAFINEDDCEKLALFLEDAISKHLRTQAPATTQ